MIINAVVIIKFPIMQKKSRRSSRTLGVKNAVIGCCIVYYHFRLVFDCRQFRDLLIASVAIEENTTPVVSFEDLRRKNER
jgi:mRNA deadenylase 3'-5' endonuclease subunit Ccr4